VTQILGLFSYFHEYIQDFARTVKPLTEITELISFCAPEHFPWGSSEQEAFEKLKELLIEATVNPRHITDCSKLFSIDACDLRGMCNFGTACM
jgi:hypothetical protein